MQQPEVSAALLCKNEGFGQRAKRGFREIDRHEDIPEEGAPSLSAWMSPLETAIVGDFTALPTAAAKEPADQYPLPRRAFFSTTTRSAETRSVYPRSHARDCPTARPE